MRNAHLLLIGGLSACAFLVGIALELEWLKMVAKPWPVLMLAAWVWPSADKRIAVGLVFGAIGDICLSFPSGFLPGMVAFAIGHGLYVIAFISWNRGRALSLLGVTAVYLLGMLFLLLPHTGALTIPVTVYVSVIGLMIWRAAALAADESALGLSRWLPLCGALFFGFSDTLIGINKFVQPMPASAYPIILLYWLGQGLIAAAAHQRIASTN